MKTYSILTALFAGVSILAISTADPAGYGFMLLVIMTVCLLCLNHSKWTLVLFTALIIRLGASLTLHYLLPDLDPDVDGYLIRAEQWSGQDRSTLLDNATSGAYFYSWLLSLLYRITYPSELLVRMLNVLFGVLTCFNTMNIASLLRRTSSGVGEGWIIALFPSLILISATRSSRDSLIIFLFTSSICLGCYYYREASLKTGIAMLVCSVLSTVLHSAMVIVLLLLCALMAFVAVKRKNKVRTCLFFVILVTTCLFLFSIGIGMDKFASVEPSPGGVRSVQESGAAGRAAYLPDYLPATGADVVLMLPLRILYFLCAPFPWMVSSARDVVGLLDGACYMIMIAIVLYRARIHERDSLRLFIATVLTALIVLFSVVVSNYGTAMRHRAKVAPVLVALAGSMAASSKRRQKHSMHFYHRSAV